MVWGSLLLRAVVGQEDLSRFSELARIRLLVPLGAVREGKDDGIKNGRCDSELSTVWGMSEIRTGGKVLT